MTERLLNELRYIDAEIPAWATTRDAAKMLRPRGEEFSRGSFWRVLCDRLPFARSGDVQEKIADWLEGQRTRAEKAGRQYPPKAIVTKRAILPAPNPL